MSDNILTVSDSEHLTILNALRFWQAAGRPVFPELMEGQVVDPVAEQDLDAFIERISTDVNLSMLLTIENGLVTNAYVPGASERLCINVFDMDTDGVEEDDLEELALPFLGIQSGSAYSVGRNIAAPEFMVLLEKKWSEELPPVPNGRDDDTSDDVQSDLFVSHDEIASAELAGETSERELAETADA